jgi:hypothetical protein
MPYFCRVLMESLNRLELSELRYNHFIIDRKKFSLTEDIISILMVKKFSLISSRPRPIKVWPAARANC